MPKKNKVSKSKWLDLLIFALFLNVFFFHSFGTVALALLLTGGYVLTGRVFGKFGLGSSALFGISILTMFLVNSPEKIVLLTLLAIAILLVTAYLGLKREGIGGILELTLSSLLVVREYIRSGLMLLASAMRGTLRKALQLDTIPKERSPWIKSIAVGLVVGLPLTAWLISTLSNADPVFAAFIKDLLSEKFLSELPGRLVMSGVTLLLLMPILLIQWRGYRSPLAWISRVRFGREMSIVLLMVVVILGLFLAVQWPYVFASVARETDLSQYGVATYSEYVTKGFWDLLKVAVMVFGVSWITLLIAKNQRGKEYRILLAMQGILGLEFVVFISSIFRRVWLYQSYHGLTLARLYGLVLLIWVVGMMVTMGLRYLHQNIRWVRVEVTWMMIVIFGAIAINMESLIIKDPPLVNGRVDYVYLSRMSVDGYGGWLSAYKHVRGELARIVNEHPVGIGVDNRREILYSSMILSNLSRQYDELVWKYGSEGEIKDYLRKVFDWEEIMLIQYPEIATSKVTGGREQVIKEIQNARKMIESSDWEKTGLVVWNTSNYYHGTYTFAGYEPSFYGINPGGLMLSKRLEKWDLMLSWNSREARVYQQMKQEIPSEELLQAMSDYWKLRLQIITQPETERSVEVDLSFESPFLR